MFDRRMFMLTMGGVTLAFAVVISSSVISSWVKDAGAIGIVGVLTERKQLALLVLISFTAMLFGIAALFVGARKLDAVQESRQQSFLFKRLERRMIDRLSEFQDTLINKNTLAAKDLKELVDEKITDSFLSSIDEKLAERVGEDYKRQESVRRVAQTTLGLTELLEAQSYTAEREATFSLWLANGLAVLGVLFAVYRLYETSDVIKSLTPLYMNPEIKSLWPIVILSSIPWIGAVAVIEFTAVLLMRSGDKARLRVRQYMDSIVELKDRHAAISLIIEVGTAEDIVNSSKAMIVYGQRQMSEASDTQTFNASAELVQSVTDLLKEVVSKVGAK